MPPQQSPGTPTPDERRRTAEPVIGSLLDLLSTERRALAQADPSVPSGAVDVIITSPVVEWELVAALPMAERHRGGVILSLDASARLAKQPDASKDQSLLTDICREVEGLLEDVVFCYANAVLFSVEHLYPFHQLLQDVERGMQDMRSLQRAMQELEAKYDSLPGRMTEALSRTEYALVFLTHSYIALSAAFDCLGRALHLLVHGRDVPRCSYGGEVKDIENASTPKATGVKTCGSWPLLKEALKWYEDLGKKRNVLAHRASWAAQARFQWPKVMLPDTRVMKNTGVPLQAYLNDIEMTHFQGSIATMAFAQVIYERLRARGVETPSDRRVHLAPRVMEAARKSGHSRMDELAAPWRQS